MGIKKKDQDKLFHLFGSIKDEKKKINISGIGLGLVISKLIVEKFEGSIDFVSKFKKGTIFFYTFKLDPDFDEIDEQLQALEEKSSTALAVVLRRPT